MGSGANVEQERSLLGLVSGGHSRLRASRDVEWLALVGIVGGQALEAGPLVARLGRGHAAAAVVDQVPEESVVEGLKGHGGDKRGHWS